MHVRSESHQSLIELMGDRLNERTAKHSVEKPTRLAGTSSGYPKRARGSVTEPTRNRPLPPVTPAASSSRGHRDTHLHVSYSGRRSNGTCRWTLIFDPAGRLCYYWSMVVSLAFLYNFWTIIYRCTFQEIRADTVVAWFLLDYSADLIYVLDICFHFRTGYLEDGVLQTDTIKLRTHYLNSTLFYIDALCLLPLDFLYLSIGFNSLLRCFRLVKIYKFWAFMDRTERHTNYPNVWRTVSLLHYLMACFHWNSCLFHIILTKDGLSEQFAPERSYEREDVVLAQLHALYWSTRILTTVGELPRPSTRGDYVFLVTQLLLGMFLFAAVLGHVANIVANISAARKEFQAKLDGVKTYMRLRHVPRHLQNKVIKWFDYLWLTQKSSDEDRSVGCLPDKLKAEIAIYVHLDTLKRVEIFQNTEAGFLCELVLRLRPVLFSPGDYICRKGEVGRNMYIVNKGRLQVVGDDGKHVLATLKAGSYFGEISILNMGTAGNRRTASVRSVGYSDLFVLSKNDMEDVLKDYPAARLRLESIASKRLEKNKVTGKNSVLIMRTSQRYGVHHRPAISPTVGSAALGADGQTVIGRSSSTPVLVETSGYTNIRQEWFPQTTSGGYRKHSLSIDEFSPTSPDSRSKEARCQTLDSMLSEASSDARMRPPLPSIIKTSASPVPQFASPNLVPGIRLTPSTLQASPASTNYQQFFRPINSAAGNQSLHSGEFFSGSGGSSVGGGGGGAGNRGSFSGGHTEADSRCVIASASPEALITEIERLRERLCELEAENQTMSSRLSQQQWEVQHRLAEIELQLCAAGSSAASLSDDTERNQESAI